MRWFFIGSTCFLLILAAGLFTRAVAAFESHRYLTLAQAPDADSADVKFPSVDPRTLIW